MITFPLWFKIFLGWFGFLIITGTTRFLSKNKYIDSIKKMPDEKKEKLNKTYSFVLFILKFILWAIPINLFLVPYLIYKYSPDNFFHISVMMIIAYILVTEEFLFRRSVLSRLKN